MGTGVLTLYERHVIIAVEVRKMPRSVRKKSKSGIYHIMLRGVNRQPIFVDDEDRSRFIQIVNEKKTSIDVYSYCLMDNHVHLLLKDENLAITMRSLCARYVLWFNKKHKRCGNLFQDRFMSEPVENDRYFLTVLRYIHQNPLKAEFCQKVEDYQWSSYNEYIDKPKIVNTRYVFRIISPEEFIKFNNANNRDVCLEMKNAPLSDEDARRIISEITGLNDLSDIQLMEKYERKKLLYRIKENDSLSIRQIARVTGLSRKTVEVS